MIAHRLNGGHVFGRNHDRLALPFVCDGAPKLDNPILDNDVDQGGGRPGLAGELGQQRLANGLIAGR